MRKIILIIAGLFQITHSMHRPYQLRTPRTYSTDNTLDPDGDYNYHLINTDQLTLQPITSLDTNKPIYQPVVNTELYSNTLQADIDQLLSLIDHAPAIQHSPTLPTSTRPIKSLCQHTYKKKSPKPKKVIVPKKLTPYKQVLSHFNAHTSPSVKMKCQECNETSGILKQRNKFVDQHTKNTGHIDIIAIENTIICRICQKSSESVNALALHMANCKHLICPCCNKKMSIQYPT